MGETDHSSYRGGTFGFLGPISGVTSSEGGDGGDPPATNPVSPGFRALMRLIFSFSFSSCVLISGRGFEAPSLLCTIKQTAVSGQNLLCNEINAFT